MRFNVSLLTKNIRTALFLLPISLLTACSDSNDSAPVVEPPPPPPPPPVEVSLNGAGVKGPMALANVHVYAIDANSSDFKGELISSATTDSAAQITGLTLTEPLSPPYLLEITAVDGSFDITTNEFPVISTVLTVITQELLDSGDNLYATPLTTMAVNLAIANADTSAFGGNEDGSVSSEEIITALPIAAEQVKSTLGFGIDDDVDIYNTPPLINDETDTVDEQASTTAYRSAVEAFTAVVYQMQELSGDTESDTNDIIAHLASDLSDGVIDGAVDGDEVAAYNNEALDVLQQDPATLPIPNDPENRTVADVKEIILTETAQTGSETDTSTFNESEEVIELAAAEISADIDNDGVLNSQDAFPEDASADSDNDGDGIPDVAFVLAEGVRTEVIDTDKSDDDDDNDGIKDENDAFPLDATEFADTDNDGLGNNADDDDDNDGVLDISDDFPLDATKFSATDQDNDGWESSQDSDDNDNTVPGIAFVDTDGDGLANDGGNTPDDDDDGDGVDDIEDAFPLNAAESADLDNDGIGNNADTDIDGDGIANEDDLFPLNSSESIDSDGDGIGNNTDQDDDGDSLSDAEEQVLGTNPLMADTDGDGVFDNIDVAPLDPNERLDSDSDNVGNNSDNCPLVANELQQDTDNDGFGNACDLDDDNDGVVDTKDDFPLDATRFDATIEDTDGDGIFDNVDTDDDNDNVLDVNDAFPLDSSESVDTDNDGIGNNSDTDDDNDNVLDTNDAFPLNNSESVDTDNDGQGNNADTDDDGDNVADADDAFPLDSTESVDTDVDGIGNNSDTDDDNDGVVDANDAFPLNSSESVDTDNDGQGNNADTDDDGDNVADADDAFPLDSTESVDTDNDGQGNNADSDDDGDNVTDADDAFPLDATESVDTDGDSIGNNADPDDDNDGVVDSDDTFPLDSTESVDTDGDGVGDNGDAFPADANEWLDTDEDGIGDNADVDANDPNTRFGGLADAFLNGSVALLEADDGELEEYGYELIQYLEQNNTTEFQQFSYNLETQVFEQVLDDENNDSYVLTPEGWQVSVDDYQIVSLHNDGLVKFANSQGEQIDVHGQLVASDTGNIVDILAANKALYDEYGQADQFWSDYVDPSAIFSADAQVYQMSFTVNSNSYEIWNDQHCNNGELVGGLCNFAYLQNNQSTHPQGALATLDELLVEQEWSGVDSNHLQTVWVAGRNADHQELRAELLASGESTGQVNFYIADWSENYTVRKLSVTGQWLRQVVYGEEILTFEIPSDLLALLEFDIEAEDMKRLFAKVNNFVREGSYAEVGDVESEKPLWVNQVAIEEIIANFVVVDTDGDGVNDAEDHDDDNDGIDDVNDSHPKNANESLDTDGDGIGNNTDTDDDNDGVADSEDLAPLDDSVGMALTFTVDNLSSDYVKIHRDSPIEPKIQLGFLSGKTIHFATDNSGYNSDLYGQENFTWSLSDNVLLITPTGPVAQTQWMNLEELIKLNIITEAQANGYRAHYGDGLEIETTEISRTWSLIDDSDIVDSFWVEKTSSYQIVDIEHRVFFFGSENAVAKVVSDGETELEVEQLSQLVNLGFTNEQVIGQWTLPFTIGGNDRFLADLLSFSADGTGAAEISALSFTWQINAENKLVVTIDNTDEVITYQLAEEFAVGVGIYAQHSTIDNLRSGYTFALKATSADLTFNLHDDFLMSSFILTNESYYDQDGNIKFEEYFGFKLFSDNYAQRISGWGLIQGNEPETWFWQQEANDRIVLSARVSKEKGSYIDCDLSLEDCEIKRRRFWQPLAQDGNRLYVLEWSQWNDGVNDDSTTDEVWRDFIPTRINFYQVYPLNEGDTSIDSDNDGIPNLEDAFPFDNFEWLDTDGDGVGNNADIDDDSDGVNDQEDAFPLDDSESVDTDGDAIGNNADTDDDNDGVNDGDDLAPLDDTVGMALAFTRDNLASKYIQIIQGRLADPSIRLGSGSGSTYEFGDQGTGILAQRSGGEGYDWSLDNNVLSINYSAATPSTSYPNVDRLAELGVITQEAANNFINSHGYSQIHVEITVSSEQWQLLEDTNEVDSFWASSTSTYRLVDDWEREQLLGSVDAAPVDIQGNAYSINLTESDILTAIAFTEDEVVGTWALPLGFAPMHEDPNMRLVAEQATFNADNTGSGLVFNQSFTWLVNGEGQLEVTLNANNEHIVFTQYEQYGTGVGLLASAQFDGKTYSTYRMAVKSEAPISLDENIIDHFMMNSFTMTNPNAFDEQGNVFAEEVFGFRLETGGSVARIFDGNFNPYNYRDGWDNWSWKQLEDNSIILSATTGPNYDLYQHCNPEESSDCNNWRRRHWQPLARVGDRLYILEWEERNDNAWNFPSEEESWYIAIPPRVQFYQVFALDFDHDGVNDDVDLDDDNDGVADIDDAFPLDVREWLDTDGDTIGNNADDDDDNDGVYDWDDAFPLDSTEWADVDHDGIGDNADTDNDNDGVANADDLAPLDDEVGQAIALTADNLANHYIQIVRGKLTNPTLRLGYGSGNQLDFSQPGIGSNVNSDGMFGFSWSIANDVMTLTLDEVELSTNHMTLVELVELGVVTQSAADNFIIQFGFNQGEDIWLEVEVEKTSETWQLLEDATEVDRFWLVDNQGYNFVNSDYRESLLGDINAGSVEVASSGSKLTLTDKATLIALPFTAEEIIGQWALPIAIDPNNDDGRNRFTDDLVTFNADNTGITQIFAEAFTWQLDGEGSLVVTITATGAEILYTRYENYATGMGVHALATLAGNSYSSYTMAVEVSGVADINAFTDQFVMNSFTLTNQNTFDEDGNVYADDYFGFRLETGGNVTRVLTGDLNITEDRNGWDRWSWQQESDGSITIASTNHEFEGLYTNCDVETELSCKQFRIRHWQPLQQVGDRLYVLEWEERNFNAFDFPSEENKVMWIKPRVQFYQIHDLDSDNDGEIDARDWDDDNDGYSDQDDAYPFDSHEQLDSDGDGVGNNADDFPFDSTEWLDTDGDGIGNNADDDDDNDGKLDINDLNPLVSDYILADVQFADAELATCINEQHGSNTQVNQIHYLDCSYRSISDISDIDQLALLSSVSFNGNQEITDYSSLTQLVELDYLSVSDSSFSDNDLAMFAGHAKLRHVNFTNSGITSLDGFANMPNLEVLSLWGDKVFDLTPLAGMSQLRELHGQRSMMTNLAAIDGLQLKYLALHGALSPENIGVISSLISLDGLNLGWDDSLGDVEFNQLIQALPNLTSLHFAGTQLTDISQLANYLPNLRQLEIHNTQVSDLSALLSLTELHWVNIDQLPIADQTQIDALIANGVSVSGTPVQGVLVSSLVFMDAELQACVNEQSYGGQYTGQFTHLDCAYRPISDISDIHQLAYINHLNLNGIQDVTDFSAISLITALTYLDIQSSSFSNDDLVSLSTLTELKTISLGSSAVTDISSAANIVNLQNLFVFGDNIFDLSALSNINTLGINRIQVTDLPTLSNLSLTKLTVYGALSTEDILTISSLTNLQRLTVADANLGNEDFNQLVSNLLNLEYIGFTQSQLSDLSMLPIYLPNLSQLDIFDTQVADLSPLLGLTNLHYVNINGIAATAELEAQIQTLIGNGVDVQGQLVY